MNRLMMVVSVAALFLAQPVAAHDGMVTMKSEFGVAQTASRFEQAVEKRGLTLFTRIDHSAGAKKAGLALRPTILLLFGNPKVGTPMMQCSQTAGIDLPQKALIWQDEKGEVWLGYNQPEFLAKRHHFEQCNLDTSKVSKALVGLAREATQE